MRTASDALKALLATRQFFSADLYTFTLPSGDVLRYTSFDVDVTANGNTYSSALGWERTQARWQVGLTVDTMDVTLHATPDQLLNGVPIIESIAAGDWDGALCTVERAFMATPRDTSAGTVIIFSGWVGQVTEIGRIHAKMQLRSKMGLLNTGLPKALFGPSCRHVLFDSGCGLDRASFTTTGSVGAGSTTSVIQTGLTPVATLPGPTSAPTLGGTTASDVNLPYPITYWVCVTYTTAYGETTPSPETGWTIAVSNGLLTVASPPAVAGATGWNVYIGFESGNEQLQNVTPLTIGTNYTIPKNGIYASGQPAIDIPSKGWYAQGVIAFTSGANAGSRRVIESNNGGSLTLRVPLAFAPSAGDTFSISPGCDHSMAACNTKFNNLIHFGGEPYVPIPETTL